MRPSKEPEVLLVTKPLVPPWDDSAKNIARAQLCHASAYRYRALITKNAELADLGPRCTCVPVYDDPGTYAAGPRQNLRVFGHALRPRGAALYHFFFAPNPLTSMAGRTLRRLAGVPCVQTICSIPKQLEDISSLLFADAVIALSEHTRRLCLASGFPSRRLFLVRPGIEPIAPPSNPVKLATKAKFCLKPQTRLVLYPGDLEFSSASRTVAQAAPAILAQTPDAAIVFACRAKTPSASKVLAELKTMLAAPISTGRVLFLESVQDMPALVGASDAVVLPAESLYAKMDAPLVVLEAMSQQVPVVLADTGPLAELLETGCGLGVAPAAPKRLSQAVSTILSTPLLAQQLGRKGAQAVATTFNAETMAHAVEAVYHKVLP
jgi:glycosyltransferase involved in cell wall biosynthesis